MDIRPLAEAVMETAGKIKNDNMSDQDFYKFQFVALKNYNITENICQKWQVFFFCYGADMLLFLYPFLGGGERHGKPYSGYYR